jgi:hypothetical protein
VTVEDLGEPFQRHLVSLARPAAMVAGILAVFMCDAGLGEVVAEQPVTPVQAVVVIRTDVEQDALELVEVGDPVVDVDDGVEAEPAIPDLLDQLATRPGDR